MSWRESLLPASFRGVAFHIEANSRSGGRRGQTYEFPKRDASADEDLGRRFNRVAVTGYILGDDHHVRASLLELALSRVEEPGTLILPLMGSMRCRCDTYTRVERRQEGNVTSFDMFFVEASQTVASLISEATKANVGAAADKAGAAAAAAADKGTASPQPIPAPTPPETISV